MKPETRVFDDEPTDVPNSTERSRAIAKTLAVDLCMILSHCWYICSGWGKGRGVCRWYFTESLLRFLVCLPLRALHTANECLKVSITRAFDP